MQHKVQNKKNDVKNLKQEIQKLVHKQEKLIGALKEEMQAVGIPDTHVENVFKMALNVHDSQPLSQQFQPVRASQVQKNAKEKQLLAQEKELELLVIEITKITQE